MKLLQANYKMMNELKEEKENLISVIKDYSLVYLLSVSLEEKAAEKKDILFDESSNIIDSYEELVSQYKSLKDLIRTYEKIFGTDLEINAVKNIIKLPKNPWKQH